MILYKKVDSVYFPQYDTIPMLVHVASYYRLEKINRGLGGINLVETPIEPYIKDMSVYEIATEYEKQFNISNWAVFMAFEDETPVGGVTVVSRTKDVIMLTDRDDLAILWDIRVADTHKRQGIGQTLFNMVVEWSKSQGLKQMKIECQNINIAACNFYHKQGAALSAFDEYAYYNEPECRHEVQLIWFLDF